MTHKKVSIYIRVYFNMQANTGVAISVWDYQGKTKEIVINVGGAVKTTGNREIIKSVTRAIEALKEPCFLTIHTQTNFGFKLLDRPNKKWVHREAADELLNAIRKGNHIVTYVDCSATEEGKQLQKMLGTKVKS